MTIQADAQYFDFQRGVASKLVPMADGSGTYGPAVVAFQPLAPAEFDYIALGYDGSGNLTGVTYKLGGSGGTTVATLTLAYDGSGNLTSVTRS